MRLTRQKALDEIDRLLKQGRGQAALTKLEDLARSHPSDLTILNRTGDLLAKQGRHREAIEYYDRIAQSFRRSGFVPKAVAIYKKMLRLNPELPTALVQLGDLFLSQELPGEARGYLLRAAEINVKTQQFDKAREVYERLVIAEPDDPRHRARLAEARAAEGDVEKAAEDLVLLGESLRGRDKPEEAEQAFRRAIELAPNRVEPLTGIAACLFDLGRGEEGLKLLEQQAAAHGSASLRGELACRYSEAGRTGEALDALFGAGADEISHEIHDKVFRTCLGRQQVDVAWQRFDETCGASSNGTQPSKVVRLLERLAGIEHAGQIPALERLVRLHQQTGHEETPEALEWLIRAYETHSMDAEAATARKQLEQLRAASHSPRDSDAVPTQHVGEQPYSPTGPAVESDPSPSDASAVPLNRADEEFVTGRMTQAEIFEKYGLNDQALAQLREVAARFPGYGPAHERLAAHLESRNDMNGVRDALVALAVARRAAGDVTGAREAVTRADRKAGLDPETRTMLERLSLTGPVDVPTAEPAAPAPAAVASAPDGAAEGESAPPQAAEVVIDFEAFDEEEQPPVSAPATAQPVPEPEPVVEIVPDVVAEPVAGAAERAEADTPPGPEEQSAPDPRDQDTEPLVAEPSEPVVADPLAEQPEPVVLEPDEDLSAIAAALESELFADDLEGEAAPESESEESLEEVFAAFKQHVNEEIGTEDFRTHYDLGIAYKEMGLVDDAIEAFQQALGAEELKGEASSMLALCHRERGDMTQAARWYREALDTPTLDVAVICGLRYDLADLLLRSGDAEGALGLFREVLQSDPSYRDVRTRVTELESHSGS